MTFPPSKGPIEVTLTRPVDDIPRQRGTPAGQPQLAYELKIDGWRLVLSKTPAGAEGAPAGCAVLAWAAARGAARR